MPILETDDLVDLFLVSEGCEFPQFASQIANGF